MNNLKEILRILKEEELHYDFKAKTFEAYEVKGWTDYCEGFCNGIQRAITVILANNLDFKDMKSITDSIMKDYS